jgi:alkylation response protein AidB-like acyl-CoA dehydrogenase
MNLTFTEEQEILRKFASDFLTEKYPKKFLKEMEASAEGYSPQIWKEMAELGWMGLPFPEKYGGTGMTVMDQMVLLEEMGRAAAQSPYFATVILGAFPIYDFGSEEQKQKYLPDIISGSMILTLALTEKDGSMSAASIETKAVKSGQDYIINGAKMFVPFAHVADFILCAARTNASAAAEKAITIFIVPAKTAGVSCAVMDSIAGKPCEVILKDVKVGEDMVLGSENQGWKYISSILRRAETAICSEMAGLGQQALDMTVQYAKDRKQFGRPIGSFQIIQHYCADMFIELDGMKLNAYKAAWKMDENLECDEDVAMAKAWAVQASEKILGSAHQIHGAIGSTIEYDLHYYTRRMKALALTFGDTKYYREIIAQKMGL